MEAKTEKIRVTVTSKETKELEIRFPYYVRDRDLYCKFLSKGDAIWVCDFRFNRAIEHSTSFPDSWLTFDPITEEEFNAKFNEVMTDLIDINNEKSI